MRKLTETEVLRVGLTLRQCLTQFVAEYEEFRLAYLKNLAETDLVFEHDLRDLAVEAFLHKLKERYEHYKSMEDAVLFTKRILDDPDTDTETA